ncbi:MAG: septum formation initiator family protein [Clostridia bacterium]|nr:septum formation initiator family protein [Clostridia bacterium]
MSHYFQTVRPRFWAFFFAGLICALIALYAAQQSYIRRQEETIASLSAEYTALQQASSALEEKIDYTYTDEYIEREARGKLGLIYEDETLYQASGVGADGP